MIPSVNTSRNKDEIVQETKDLISKQSDSKSIGTMAPIEVMFTYIGHLIICTIP